ncbi:Acyl transferase/acyl hydrolase/lysophospholipase [Syntrophomonas zehnderi OL-4]|uniref:Acyl transferase/acyl hydrolase/lysophospholipase n=1 Tax=Syntrophomonas zehnderi OL-4 TaxID=690567 RepID=A0A0E4G987_9FIRM|nr:patatin-like phospholipase family protein [Syntrophomonas zehnderi]CFX09750.1 Acyl transferase/acyl hydrolase/lysophospholipase [Syntrophomonas zehnderi OL-4]
MKSLGLALGGGGMRGMAHIGILQVLWDHGLTPEFISGTSVGSIMAAFYAAGISPYRLEKIVLGLKPTDYLDYNIGGTIKYLFSLVCPGYDTALNGVLQGNKIEKIIYRYTKGKKLKDMPLPLAIVACDIDTGKKVIFTNQDIDYEQADVVIIKDALVSEAVRASISIPVTFKPKHLQGMQMVDGGIKDILPVTVNKVMGADYVLGVNLGREIYDTKVEGILQIVSRTLSILTYETSDLAEEIYADMIIYPKINGARLEDIGKAGIFIRAGRRAMKEKLNELKQGLKESG